MLPVVDYVKLKLSSRPRCNFDVDATTLLLDPPLAPRQRSRRRCPHPNFSFPELSPHGAVLGDSPGSPRRCSPLLNYLSYYFSGSLTAQRPHLYFNFICFFVLILRRPRLSFTA